MFDLGIIISMIFNIEEGNIENFHIVDIGKHLLLCTARYNVTDSC